MISGIENLRKFVALKVGVIYLRYLLGFAFVWASIVKIKGDRFTSIPTSDPVGYFFEAMYQSGFYWNFLGLAQFFAGALLMTQRFAFFGALVFLPVMVNVFVITHAINFGSGTPVITSLMLLGTVGLLVWDYRRFEVFFKHDHQIRIDMTLSPKDALMTSPHWTIAGIIFVALTLIIQLIPDGGRFIFPWLVAMLVTGLWAFVAGMLIWRRSAKKESA